MLAGAHQHHRNGDVVTGKLRGRQPHERGEVLEAVLLTAVFEQRRVTPQVRADLGLRQSQHAFDRRQRQCVELLVGAHDECVTDRERQRQAHREHRALAGLALHVQCAAQALDLGCNHVHADAAAGLLGDRTRGGEPRLEDELHRILIAQGLPGRDEAERLTFVADRLQIHAAAVIGETHHDLGALPMQLQQDPAGVGFAALHALFGLLDAVHDGVAQHVFERRQHALEHLPVKFPGGTLDGELGTLAGVGGRLAHDACEALHVALEGHHARAHETVLQFGNRACLLLQQGLGVLGEVRQQLLDARHVVGGLGERARVLLDGGVAVEFERVEFAAVRAFILVLMEDLRLGLDFKTAQLLLQARNGARQLA